MFLTLVCRNNTLYVVYTMMQQLWRRQMIRSRFGIKFGCISSMVCNSNIKSVTYKKYTTSSPLFIYKKTMDKYEDKLSDNFNLDFNNNKFALYTARLLAIIELFGVILFSGAFCFVLYYMMDWQNVPHYSEITNKIKYSIQQAYQRNIKKKDENNNPNNP